MQIPTSGHLTITGVENIRGWGEVCRPWDGASFPQAGMLHGGALVAISPHCHHRFNGDLAWR